MVAKKKAAKVKQASSKGSDSAPVKLEEVRERVRRVIAEKAEAMTVANAAEASKGHLAQLKYLFDLFGLCPATAGEEAEPVDSNDLARVLLKRLNFPFQGPADEEQSEPSKEAPVAAPVGDDSVK
jgi:hypothetical protein